MNISIDESILDKYNLSLNEFLVLYLCSREANIKELIDSIINKNLVDTDLRCSYSAVVSNNTKELISAIIIDSDKKVINKDEEFLNLAEKLRELYPAGIKPGTTYYWRDSAAVISKKLKTLVVKFDFHFTEEEAINATQQYIKSFNGDYRLMQLLKYFILKVDKTTGEVRSEFMSHIENKDQSNINTDWTSEIR